MRRLRIFAVPAAKSASASSVRLAVDCKKSDRAPSASAVGVPPSSPGKRMFAAVNGMMLDVLAAVARKDRPFCGSKFYK